GGVRQVHPLRGLSRRFAIVDPGVLLSDLEYEHAPELGKKRKAAAEPARSADLPPGSEIRVLDREVLGTPQGFNAFRPHRGITGHCSDFPPLAEIGLEVLGRLRAAGDLAGLGIVVEGLTRTD